MTGINLGPEQTTVTAVEEVCRAELMPGKRLCGSPAVATYQFGCVHEHVADAPLCEEHVARIEAREGWCDRCWDGDGSHQCPVQARRQP